MPVTPDTEGLFLVRWDTGAALWQRRTQPEVGLRCLCRAADHTRNDVSRADWKPDKIAWCDDAVFTVLPDCPHFIEAVLVLDPDRVVEALRRLHITGEWEL